MLQYLEITLIIYGWYFEMPVSLATNATFSERKNANDSGFHVVV